MVKRILISVVSGLVFPFVYASIIGPLTPYIESDFINDLLGVPVRWPIMALQRAVGFQGLGRFPFRDQDWVVLLTYIITCNVILYASLTYALSWFIKKPKRSPSELPPQPPPFI